MAFHGPTIKIPGLTVDSDMSANQFKFVKMSATNGQVSLCSVDGEDVLGVIQNDESASGRPAEVSAIGTTKITAGEALAAGDIVKTGATGLALIVERSNTGADIGDTAVGTVIVGAAANALATIFLGVPQGKTESA